MAGPQRPPDRGPGREPERPGPHNTALPLPKDTAKLLDASRRPGNEDNVGLWLDKFVYRRRGEWDIKENYREYALAQFARSWRSPLGAEALARRESALQQVYGPRLDKHGPRLYEELHAHVQGRLLVDYGRASAIESALSFHHTWGVPRIPGSAVKGIALLAMREQDATDAEIEAIFGTQLGPDNKLPKNARAGQMLFFDALPRNGEFTLAEDVLTPHYGAYYRAENKEPPGDWHSPKPHTFLTVVDTVFVFHLAVQPLFEDDAKAAEVVARAREWLPRVRKALLDALEWHGIGAKTAAGYGRLSETDLPPVPPDAAVQEFAEWFEARKQAGATQRELLESARSEWHERLMRLGDRDREQVAELVGKAIKSPKVAALRDALLQELLQK
jgi:CRISPR-associated protein Cmr6